MHHVNRPLRSVVITEVAVCAEPCHLRPVPIVVCDAPIGVHSMKVRLDQQVTQERMAAVHARIEKTERGRVATGKLQSFQQLLDVFRLLPWC